MRALITFIAILTVGIVTAQSGRYQESTNIGYNNGVITIGDETYTLVDEQRTDDLAQWYPNGTSRAYQWRTDVEELEHNLDRILFSYAPGVSGTLGQHYRLRFLMDNDLDGNGQKDVWGFRHALPTEHQAEGDRIAIRLSPQIRDAEIGYTPIDGYTMSIEALFQNGFTDTSGPEVYLQLRITHPESVGGDVYNLTIAPIYENGDNQMQTRIVSNQPISNVVPANATLLSNIIYQTRSRDFLGDNRVGENGDDSKPLISLSVNNYLGSNVHRHTIRDIPFRFMYQIGHPVIDSNDPASPPFWVTPFRN